MLLHQCIILQKQGWIVDTQQDSHGRLGRSSTVMRKPPEIQKCDGTTNILTNRHTDWHCKVLSRVSATKNHHSLVQITLLGSGPKGPMSCRTRVNFQMSWEGTFEAFGATFLVIQWEHWIFFHFIVNFPCYSIWILYFFQKIVNFPCYSIGISHIFNF